MRIVSCPIQGVVGVGSIAGVLDQGPGGGSMAGEAKDLQTECGKKVHFAFAIVNDIFEGHLCGKAQQHCFAPKGVLFHLSLERVIFRSGKPFPLTPRADMVLFLASLLRFFLTAFNSKRPILSENALLKKENEILLRMYRLLQQSATA